MKRKDAILKIAESLVEPRHEDVMKEAEHILKRLEVAGMRPPSYVGLQANAQKYDPVTDFSRDTQTFNGWEPEE